MAIHSPRNSFQRGSPQSSKANVIPAPIGGIDARTILSAGDPMFCIYAINLLPSEYGLKVRPGYREWQIELDNGAPLGVGTIIPFGGEDDDESDDRLFAVTNEGIWDVTAEEGTPSLVLDFTTPGNGGDISGAAGRGVFTQYTTDADVQLLFYADSRNGLFTYDASSDTWARTAGITGPDLTSIDFVMVHKNQLWMSEIDDSRGWYLPPGAIAGAATAFHFGANFTRGGDLAGMFTWTIDGGMGVDDYFVVVSRAGDVLPYQGTDPSDADKWGLTGHYFIGTIPYGHRFASQVEGNLNLLSAYGLISMDELIRGVDGKNINAQTDTLKIAAIVRKQMAQYRNEPGWEVHNIPSQGALIINSPVATNGVHIQYALNSTTRGWGLWREMPMTAFDEWAGRMYFGTDDNRVMVADVNIDNALITPVSDPNGDAIKFSILTTYQNYGEPALFKRGKYIRPEFLSNVEPNVTSRFRYDYDLTEVLNTAMSTVTSMSLWDIALWDVGEWTSETPFGWHPVTGGWGIGRNVAIATAGNSRNETTLISWDVIWDTGAPI